jgi:Thiamine pyrophosphate enzyme, N-terminal TPP binding domain
MNSSQYLATFFQAVGIERVYTLSGGMIAPLMDAIGEQSGLKLVAVSHEQSAAFAAEAEGFLMGKPGVALGTSGPGALNLVTGIASAYYDSVPTIFIGGRVQTYVAQLTPGARQSGLLTALSVCVATIIAERPGAAAGALVATLPVSAGPVYVFLALDHDAVFISASAVASLAVNTATAIFITVYVLTAQRRSLWISISPWQLRFGSRSLWRSFPFIEPPPQRSFSTWLFSLCACGSSNRMAG